MRYYLALLFTLISCVAANTEIVNIVAHTHPDVKLDAAYGERWPVFTSNNSEQLLHILPASYGANLRTVCDAQELPCVSETWVALDLDSRSWRRFSRFTLRLSYPASSPADFLIETYSPNDAQTHFLTMDDSLSSSPFEDSDHKEELHPTRRLYARIRAVSTGLRRPSPNQDRVDPVEFILLLEPLYLGAVPASVVPIIFFILVLGFIAWVLVAPFVNGYLEYIADQARAEIEERQKKKS